MDLPLHDRYLSNESDDPFMSGRIHYDFSYGGVFYLGGDAAVLKDYAQRTETLRVLEEAGGEGGDPFTNCVMLKGLGMTARLCKIEADVPEMTMDEKGKFVVAKG